MIFRHSQCRLSNSGIEANAGYLNSDIEFNAKVCVFIRGGSFCIIDKYHNHNFKNAIASYF